MFGVLLGVRRSGAVTRRAAGGTCVYARTAHTQILTAVPRRQRLWSLCLPIVCTARAGARANWGPHVAETCAA
jgi:hypothetical protein